MLQRINEQPFVFFGGCLVWVPVTIWVVCLIHWMVQGDLDVLVGLPGVLLGVLLGVFTLDPPHPSLSPLFFTASVVTVALFPSVRSALNRRALDRIDDDSVAAAYEALGEKPDNVGARLRVARIVAKRGLPAHAAAIAGSALQGLSEVHFSSEFRDLAQWRAQAAYPDADRPVACLECGALNPPGDLYCVRCRAPHLMHWLRGRWMGGTGGRKLVAGWIASVAAIVGVPSLASALPPIPALLAIAAVLALVALLLWQAFRPDRKQVIL